MTYYVTFQWTVKDHKLQEVQEGAETIKTWLDSQESVQHALVHMHEDEHLVMLLQEWQSQEAYALARVEEQCAEILAELRAFLKKDMEVKSYA